MEGHHEQPPEEALCADTVSEGEEDDLDCTPVGSGLLTISPHEEEDNDSNKVEGDRKETSLPEEHAAEDNVDSVIEGAANKCNLSVLNVKSILHHVLKDKRVLAFVQRQAAEQEGKKLEGNWKDDEITTYEPKLTRSRVRQAVASGVASGTLHPEKVVSLKKSIPTKSRKEKQVTVSLHFLDDSLTNIESSDEEYDPTTTILEEEEEEESEEESESEERVVGIDDNEKEKEESFMEDSAIVTMDAYIEDTPCLHQNKTLSASSDQNITSTVPPPGPLSTILPSTSSLSSNDPPLTSSQPSITAAASTPDTPTKDHASELASNEALVQETAALLASLSDVILSPSKPVNILSSLQAANTTYHETPVTPVEHTIDTMQGTEEDEIIAKRTRSKFPLIDTPITDIEASFIPPDAEDPPTPMEIDQEEAEWQHWLSDLLNPTEGEPSSHTDDEKMVSGLEDGEDNEDTEYNYLADNQEEEKEEFRNDRAVKISKKEVDELLNELLNPEAVGIGGLFSGDEMDLTSAYLLESLGLQPPSLLQSSQTGATLKHQQLGNESSLATSSVEERVEGDPVTFGEGRREEDPPGCYLSREQTCQLWEQIQQHYQLLMQTFVLSRYEPSLVFLSQIAAQAVEEINKWCEEAKNGQNSLVWNVPDIEDGIQLIKDLNPNSENAVELATTSTSNPPRVPDVVQNLIMDSPIFWKYPKLLPAIGFAPHVKTTISGQGTKYFTSGEDELLVLGMHHYGPLAWKEIQENIMPTKTTKQLQLRVKNQCSKRTRDNVLKHYKKTKDIKIPFKDDEQEKYTNLPQWVMACHKRRLDKEKQQEKMEEKRRTLQIIRSQSSKPLPLCPRVTITTVAMPTKPDIALGGSRRNLLTQLDSSSPSKRAHLDNTALTTNKRRGPTRKTKHKKKKTATLADTTNLSSKTPLSSLPPPNIRRTSDMEHLLFAAGLEVSDPSARFASHYLNEVKVTLAGDKQELYTQFIDTLLTAKKHQWSPCKIYSEVKVLLNHWPYLVNLFTEFLRPEECVEARALVEKYELDSVKDFVQLLQDKFQKSPLELEEVIRTLKSLDSPGVTADQVHACLLPLIRSHEDLVSEMRRFLYQLAPRPRPDDVYEEVTLCSDNENEVDECEEIVWLESPPTQSKITTISLETPTDKPISLIQSSSDNLIVPSQPVVENHHEPPPTLMYDHDDQRPRDDHEKSVPQLMDQARNEQSTVCDAQEQLHHARSNKTTSEELSASTTRIWARDEDKVILQKCWRPGHTISRFEESSLFEEIANHLQNRTATEIKSRFQELQKLFDSAKS